MAARAQAGRGRGRRPGHVDDGAEPVDGPAADRDRARVRRRPPPRSNPRDAARGHRGRGARRVAAARDGDRPRGRRRGYERGRGRFPRLRPRGAPRRRAAPWDVRGLHRRPAARGGGLRAPRLPRARRVRCVLPGGRARLRRRPRRAPASRGGGGGPRLGAERHVPRGVRGGPGAPGAALRDRRLSRRAPPVLREPADGAGRAPRSPG